MARRLTALILTARRNELGTGRGADCRNEKTHRDVIVGERRKRPIIVVQHSKYSPAPGDADACAQVIIKEKSFVQGNKSSSLRRFESDGALLTHADEKFPMIVFDSLSLE